MRVLLLCSSFNGLTQRAWAELRRDGHDAGVQLAGDADAVIAGVAAFAPDVIVCPFLKERVPAEVWQHTRTVIIHPGPPGDRGPSSLDWAITDHERVWGVTALEAVEEMDAGPIWGSRRFATPADPPRKSALYNGAVTEAAIALVHEVVAKAAIPGLRPRPLDALDPEVTGRPRPLMRQADRTFAWSDPTAHVVRRVRAADGFPGVRTELCGVEVSVFDAHPGPAVLGTPGVVLQRSHGAVLVGTGDGSVWIGHAKVLGRGMPKLPATTALGELVDDVPEAVDPVGHREIAYSRTGPVGVLSFDFYNGAMSTRQCARLAWALRHAVAQDTSVLVVHGGSTFSNGIHLNVIEAAADPCQEAWDNIVAIDDVCREIVACTSQLVVASVGGNAGAGGVMLALGADEVLLRDGVVLNPHYRTMGLFGSEYWTYVLPRRVGHEQARALTARCEPVDSATAVGIGLADRVVDGRRGDFDTAVLHHALQLASSPGVRDAIDAKRERRSADEAVRPLEDYREAELAAMRRDIFDDLSGFAAARRAFVRKQPALPRYGPTALATVRAASVRAPTVRGSDRPGLRPSGGSDRPEFRPSGAPTVGPLPSRAPVRPRRR